MKLLSLLGLGNNAKSKTLGAEDFNWSSITDGQIVATNKTFKHLEQEATLYSCIMILSQDVAKVPLVLYREKEDGSKVRATKHPLYKALLREGPNDYQTTVDFKEMMVEHLLKRGNSYIFIERNYRYEVTDLHILRADIVTPYESEDGEIFYGVSPQQNIEKSILNKFSNYMHEGRFMIPSEHILQIKDRPGKSSSTGASRVSSQKEIIKLSLKQKEFQSSLMDNRAVPAIAIETDKTLKSEAKQKFKRQWESSQVGAGKAFKTVVLDEGMKINPVKVSSTDMQFIEQMKMSNKDIAKLFRVPMSKLMEREGATYNNNESENLAYLIDALMPIFEKIEASFAKYLFSGTDYFVEFDFSRLLKGDIKAQSEIIKTTKQWGILTTNEIRKDYLSKSSIDGGDTLHMPLNMGDAKDLPGAGDKND